jgi:hypothetical protein
VKQSDAFQTWREESDTVEAEMNVLFSTGLVAPEERQVRKMRFMALLQRREAAAQELLKHVRRSSSLYHSRIRADAREKVDDNRECKEQVRPPELMTDLAVAEQLSDSNSHAQFAHLI